MVRVRVSDGTDIEVHEAGRKASRAVVLLHGFSSNATAWTPTRSAIAARARVLCPDFRGHGDSSGAGTADDFTLDRLCRDTIEVADALEVSTMLVVGHGMGGYVAQLVALEAPGRLTGLMLVGTGPGPFDPDTSWETNRLHLARMVEAKGMAAAWEAYVEAGLVGWELEELPEEIVSTWRTEFMKTAPAAFVGLTRSMALQIDRRPALARLRVPTVVVLGDEDQAFQEGCRELAETIPGARLEIIPGAGHSPQIMDADAFNAVLLEFMKSTA